MTKKPPEKGYRHIDTREVVKELLLRKPQAQKDLYEKFHAVESSSQRRKSFCQATTILIPKLDANGIQKGNRHGQRQRKTPKLHISKAVSALSR